MFAPQVHQVSWESYKGPIMMVAGTVSCITGEDPRAWENHPFHNKWNKNPSLYPGGDTASYLKAAFCQQHPRNQPMERAVRTSSSWHTQKVPPGMFRVHRGLFLPKGLHVPFHLWVSQFSCLKLGKIMVPASQGLPKC